MIVIGKWYNFSSKNLSFIGNMISKDYFFFISPRYYYLVESYDAGNKVMQMDKTSLEYHVKKGNYK